MLQTAGLPTGALIGELVEFARALYPHPLDREDILERAGLGSLAKRRVETLSGGETQRVRFALAVAGDPDLLFLDEPTVAMDLESRRAFWIDMRRFAAEGRTVLFAPITSMRPTRSPTGSSCSTGVAWLRTARAARSRPA
jgi:ABC-2 type transport system ATP-binding protein